MNAKRPTLTVVIVENRQMIATILAEVLIGAGYLTRIVPRVADAEGILPDCQPGMLLVDMGMVRSEQREQWQRLQERALVCNMPVLAFSCSASPELPADVLVLRSPGDFAAVVQRIETEWRRKQPFIGTKLVEQGLLSAGELEVALRVQRELAQVGRNYPLGDLLVRLGIVSAEDVEKALQSPDE